MVSPPNVVFVTSTSSPPLRLHHLSAYVVPTAVKTTKMLSAVRLFRSAQSIGRLNREYTPPAMDAMDNMLSLIHI